jgi:hypothetical protein
MKREVLNASMAFHGHCCDLLCPALYGPRCLPWRSGVPPSTNAFKRASVGENHCCRLWRRFAGRFDQCARWSTTSRQVATPAIANEDTIILLHGVGGKREGMGGLPNCSFPKATPSCSLTPVVRARATADFRRMVSRKLTTCDVGLNG